MEVVPIATKFDYFTQSRLFSNIINSRQSHINLFIYLLLFIQYIKFYKQVQESGSGSSKSWALIYRTSVKNQTQHSVQKVWTPSSIDNSYMDNRSHFISFFLPINSQGKVISSCLEGCKTTLQVLSYKQQLYKQHSFRYQRELKKKHCQ